MLAPLTKIMLTKVKFKWIKIEQDAFDKINWIAAPDTLLTYPDLNTEFKIYTNASKIQLGEVINQKCKLIAFYIRKLTDAQNRYTVP